MYMIIKRGSIQTFILLTLCVSIILFSGCGGAKALRDAQDAFNKAATIDTQKLFKGQETIQAEAKLNQTFCTEKPEIYYRLALDHLESINELTKKKSLQTDGLWRTKLMLEALCHWKLGHHDKARSIAKKGAKHATDVAEPRDQVVLTILPALIKIDQAQAIAALENPDEEKVKKLLLNKDYGAKAHIDEVHVLLKDQKRPDLETYATQVELSIYQVWDRGIGLDDSQTKTVSKLLCRLYEKSQSTLSEPKALALAKKWRDALSIPSDHVKCLETADGNL